MRIFTELQNRGKIEPTDAVTIGNFDGVHLGHQAILKRVKALGKSSVVTFSNHPSTVFRPQQSTPLICSPEHKLKLLEQLGLDTILLLPFTRELSEYSAEEFLQRVRQFLPFHSLILGYDAVLGKGRKGDSETIKQLSRQLNFQVEYLPQQVVGGIPISSSLIRSLIQQGDLSQAEKLLGRPFSIYKPVSKGQGLGKTIGYATANVEVEGLCLPPYGVYAIRLLCDNQEFPGVANLGVAPTVRNTAAPILEAHLFNCEQTFYGKMVEIVLVEFLRPEKKFETLNDLKVQIAHDTARAKSILGY